MNNNNLDPNNLGPTTSTSNNQNSEQQNYTVPPVYTEEPKNNKNP